MFMSKSAKFPFGLIFFNQISSGVFINLDDLWNVVFADDVPE